MVIKEIKKSGVILTVELNQEEIDFIYAVMRHVGGDPVKSLRSVSDDIIETIERYVKNQYNGYMEGKIYCEMVNENDY